MRTTIVTALLLASCSTASADPACDAAAGERVFATKCIACHSVAADGAHAAGPNLRHVIGRRAGSATGYSYSPAMKALGVSWSFEEIDRFVNDPAAAVPGTYMAFTGVKRESDRRAVVCFLQSLAP